ncbi:MAG TPA: leucyl aminopeptidase [Bryobacteraceae bacterium]|nr:leucyl aminopeptidase [Bryobacteraceae bacterium]
MNVILTNQTLAAVEADALLILQFDADGRPATPGYDAVRAANPAWLEDVETSGEAKGRPFESTILHRPQGFQAKRIVLLGAGKAAAFDAGTLRRIVAAAVRKAKANGSARLAFALDAAYASAPFVSALAEGFHLGNFEVDTHKSKKDDRTEITEFRVVVADPPEDLQQAFYQGNIIGEAQNFTRELVNEPGNILTPPALVERARAMAGLVPGLEVEVLDQDAMAALGMGSLLGVAQGSPFPPSLIVVRYKPAAPPTVTDHLALIGKAVTFDTGGVSIKPADGMEKMKYDMAGGAAVLGAMLAIASLKPSIPVSAFVPVVENAVGGNSQRPGDIVTSLSGKTIEVLNTDAEGRLILVDAIEYARRQGVTHMVDVATLTGAIVVALGHIHVGLFSNNDAFRQKFQTSAARQGEKMWHMPLDDEYRDYLKSPFADIANIGGRWGGSITAAYFLKEWVGDIPWVHLDIAGTGWLEENKPYMPKGPSGVCVRTFIDLALHWTK